MMIDRRIHRKLLCDCAWWRPSCCRSAGVLFPYVSAELERRMQFQALEAVVSATVGFGIYRRSSAERKFQAAKIPDARLGRPAISLLLSLLDATALGVGHPAPMPRRAAGSVLGGRSRRAATSRELIGALPVVVLASVAGGVGVAVPAGDQKERDQGDDRDAGDPAPHAAGRVVRRRSDAGRSTAGRKRGSVHGILLRFPDVAPRSSERTTSLCEKTRGRAARFRNNHKCIAAIAELARRVPPKRRDNARQARQSRLIPRQNLRNSMPEFSCA